MLKRLLVWTLGLTLLLGATVAPAGAANSATAPTPKPAVGGQLNLAMEQDPKTFHPLYATSSLGTPISKLLYASLFEFDEHWEPKPYVAKSWTVSPDGLSWTITLRQDVRFQGGAPLTADDVVYTLNALKRLGTVGDYVGDHLYAVYAKDRYTVRIQLNKPIPWLATEINVGIVQQNTPIPTPQELESPTGAAGRIIVLAGAGPYRFTDYKPGVSVTLERNPDWFMSAETGGAPFIARVVYRYTGSSAETAKAFAEGSLDMAPVAGWKLPATRREQVNSYRYDRYAHGYLSLNTTRPHLQSKAVRQALTYGLNRKALVDANVPDGYLLRSIFPESSWAFDPNVKTLEYDPVKARLLLEQDGYVLNSAGIYEKDGQPLKLELLTSRSVFAAALAPSIKRQWAEIGVDLSIQAIEFNTLYDQYLYPGKYDLALVYITLGDDPDPYSQFHSTATTTNDLNQGQYSNPVVDKLLDDGLQKTDLGARKAGYAAIQQQINDDAPVILLYSMAGYASVSKKVKGGVVVQPKTGPTYLYRWWINEQP